MWLQIFIECLTANSHSYVISFNALSYNYNEFKIINYNSSLTNNNFIFQLLLDNLSSKLRIYNKLSIF